MKKQINTGMSAAIGLRGACGVSEALVTEIAKPMEISIKNNDEISVLNPASLEKIKSKALEFGLEINNGKIIYNSKGRKEA